MSVNLKSLIGKLNDTTRGALEGAAGLCLSRTHYDVEVEHFLMKLLDASGMLADLLPEVAAMKGVGQPPEFHPEGDVWAHTLLSRFFISSAWIPRAYRRNWSAVSIS